MEKPAQSGGPIALRPLELRDVSWLYELQTDRELRQSTLQPAQGTFLACAEAIMLALFAAQRKAIIDRQTGAALGWISVSELDPAPHPAVGFEVRRAFWNRGYATRALNLLLQWQFGAQQIPAISGLVFVGNKASQRVFEKVGFTLEGNCTCDGHPCLQCGLLAKDWFQRQESRRQIGPLAAT